MVLPSSSREVVGEKGAEVRIRGVAGAWHFRISLTQPLPQVGTVQFMVDFTLPGESRAGKPGEGDAFWLVNV